MRSGLYSAIPFEGHLPEAGRESASLRFLPVVLGTQRHISIQALHRPLSHF